MYGLREYNFCLLVKDSNILWIINKKLGAVVFSGDVWPFLVKPLILEPLPCLTFVMSLLDVKV